MLLCCTCLKEVGVAHSSAIMMVNYREKDAERRPEREREPQREMASQQRAFHKTEGNTHKFWKAIRVAQSSSSQICSEVDILKLERCQTIETGLAVQISCLNLVYILTELSA